MRFVAEATYTKVVKGDKVSLAPDSQEVFLSVNGAYRIVLD
jgi:hypothetical protein